MGGTGLHTTNGCSLPVSDLTEDAILKSFGHAKDDVERRSKLMAHVGQKLILQACGPQQLGIAHGQFAIALR